MLLVAQVIPSLCALTVVATAFAGEHDHGTFLGLRGLPATRQQLVGAKLLVAIAAALGATVALWLVVWLGRGRLVDPSSVVASEGEIGEWLIGSLGTLVEVVAVGLWVSLRERRALAALIQSIAWVIAIRGLAVATASAFVASRFESPATAGMAILAVTVVVRTLAVGVFVALALPATVRWFDNESRVGFFGLQLRSHPRDPSIARIHEPVAPGVAWRLLWFQMRSFGGVGILVNALVWGLWGFSQWYGHEFSWLYERGRIVQIAAAAGIVLLGALAHRGGNAHKFFLASLGLSPRRLWASQLALPLAMALPLGGLAILVDPLFGSWYRPTVWPVALPLLCYFAWSQLMSQQTRSPINAIAKAIFASAVVSVPLTVVDSYEIPVAMLFAFAISLLVYPLVESWWRAPAWLCDLERRRWPWLVVRPAAAIVLGSLLLWRMHAAIPHFTNAQVATAMNGGKAIDGANGEEFRQIGIRIHTRLQAATARHRMVYRYGASPQEDAQCRNLARDWVAACRTDLERLLLLPYELLPKQSLSRLAENARDSSEAELFKQLMDDLLQAALQVAVEAGDVELAERVILRNPYLADVADIARWAWLPENDSQRIRKVARTIEATADPLAATYAALDHLPSYSSRWLARWRSWGSSLESATAALATSYQNRQIRACLMALPARLEEDQAQMGAASPCTSSCWTVRGRVDRLFTLRSWKGNSGGSWGDRPSGARHPLATGGDCLGPRSREPTA